MRYELQSFDGKQWRPEMVYDDKTLALADARSLMAGQRSPHAVRVLENTETESRRIFLKRRNEPETLFEVRRRKEQEAQQKAAEAERKARRKRYADWEQSWLRQRRMRAIVISSVVTAIGAGILVFALV
ncbi:MAG: hypothetical protein IRZ04_20825 [Rhodospirillales bacterium]|nr:hypothetical protein [Rhodospirillales bacterium]